MGAKFFKRFKEPEFIEKIGKDFKKNISLSFGPELLDLLEKGISPVKESKNRQPEYSESYKKQIRGEIQFFHGKNGVFAVEPDYVEQSTIKFGKSGKVKKTGMKQTKSFGAGLGVGKKERPVNLKLTGALHKSLKIDISKENPVVTFTDEKAEYHNDIGVGPKKIKRRLLPTGSGEQFTLRLFQKIINALKDAIKHNT